MCVCVCVYVCTGVRVRVRVPGAKEELYHMHITHPTTKQSVEAQGDDRDERPMEDQGDSNIGARKKPKVENQDGVKDAPAAGAVAKAPNGPGSGGAEGKGNEAEGEDQSASAGDAREHGGADKKYSYTVTCNCTSCRRRSLENDERDSLENDEQGGTSAWRVTVSEDGDGIEFTEHMAPSAGSTECLVTQETLKEWFEVRYRWEMTRFEFGEVDERGNRCFVAAFRKPATELSPERPSPERPSPEPLTLPRDDIIFPDQWHVALEIAERIRRVYSKSWSELAQDFCTVDFCIFTANLNTVADQTFNRVMKRQLCGQGSSEKDHKCRVLQYSNAKNVKKDFEEFKKRVERSKKTLFMLIADECHWGALKDSPHDKYVNDEDLTKAHNVMVILVSATPYCLLTRDSRIPETYQPGRSVPGEVHPLARQISVHPLGTENINMDEFCELNVTQWRDITECVPCKNDFWRGCFITKADIQWLQNVVPESKPIDCPKKVRYNSLINVITNQSRFRCDEYFEKPLEEAIKQRSDTEAIEPSIFLAVEYALCLILEKTGNDKEEKERKEYINWLLDLPKKKGDVSGQDVQAYLTARQSRNEISTHSPDADVVESPDSKTRFLALALELLREWKEQESPHETLFTLQCIRDLLSGEHACMQVLRIADVQRGEMVFRFLRKVRQKLEYESSFELLGDFKDLKIQESMDRTWFESIQHGKKCEHLIGKGLTPCDCETYTPPETNSSKLQKNKRCGKCGHAHVSVNSYEYLTGRPLLLVLVSKGRLGDTFPQTFRCLDMRVRNRAGQPAISTEVQELGRLCRYSDPDTKNLPYALVSRRLHDYLKEKVPKTLAELLSAHLKNLDSHMTMTGQPPPESETPQTMEEVTRFMRTSCRARAEQEKQKKTTDEEKQMREQEGAGVSYDEKRFERQLLPEQRYHRNRILLYAEPQIGKTGAYLGLIEVLRHRLMPEPQWVPLKSEEESYSSESDPEPTRDEDFDAFPNYNKLQSQTFQHTKKTPKNGKYGDPAVKELWDKYAEGFAGNDPEVQELQKKERGSTAGARKRGSGNQKPQITGVIAHARGQQSVHAPENSPQVGETVSANFSAKAANCVSDKGTTDTSTSSWSRDIVIDELSTGTLHIVCPEGWVDEYGRKLGLRWRELDPQKQKTAKGLIQSNALGTKLQQGQFEFTPEEWGKFKVPALSLSVDSHIVAGDKYFEPDWTPERLSMPEDLAEENWITFPIFTPSRKRPTTALLDLKTAMQDRPYIQIVFVIKEELKQYQQKWPEITFFQLPDTAEDKGIGFVRHWMVLVAQKICPESFRFFFMMDDNVESWKAVPMASQGKQDVDFDALPFHLETHRNGKTGRRKDVPLSSVLSHYQSPGFRDELRKFGLIGFDRLGSRHYSSRHEPLRKAHARRHVYKAIIVNLDVIREHNYNQHARVWEDLSFNLLISGREHCQDAGSKKIKKEELEAKGLWVSLGEGDEPGPAVICKCYRFAYYQRQGLLGGCDDNKAQPHNGGAGAGGTGGPGAHLDLAPLPPAAPAPTDPQTEDASAAANTHVNPTHSGNVVSRLQKIEEIFSGANNNGMPALQRITLLEEAIGISAPAQATIVQRLSAIEKVVGE